VREEGQRSEVRWGMRPCRCTESGEVVRKEAIRRGREEGRGREAMGRYGGLQSAP
jgi:hypothetical protein